MSAGQLFSSEASYKLIDLWPILSFPTCLEHLLHQKEEPELQIQCAFPASEVRLRTEHN